MSEGGGRQILSYRTEQEEDMGLETKCAPAERKQRSFRMAGASLALVAVVVLGASGCGDDSSASADQPAAVDGSLTSGQFEGLPKPDGAVPLGDPSQQANTFEQSFRIPGSTPAQILLFYGARLPVSGWLESVTPSQVGPDEWKGQWSMPGQTLQVDAVRDTDSGDNAEVSQLDLTLTDS